MKAIAALLVCVATAHAQTEPVWSVRTELLVVRVPQSIGLKLRPRLREPASTAGAVGELQEMIARHEATLIGAPVTWSKSGAHAISETVEGVMYPVKGDPPEPPHHFIVPHTFYTQNAGVTLEFEATVASDGRTISFIIVAQDISFEALTSVFQGENPSDDWRYQQPKFRTLRTVAKLTTRAGVWQLLNVSVIREPAPKMEFFLLRASAFPHQP